MSNDSDLQIEAPESIGVGLNIRDKNQKSNIIRTIINTIDGLMGVLETLSEFFVDGFSLITDFIPFINDLLPFFKYFIPLFLSIIVILEIKDTI